MKNIFLVGMPSSGKTTLGKILTRHIRYRFVDTDQMIVKNEGLPIAQIFEQKGEAYFRQAEASTLRAIRPNSKLIVSTGGGMPFYHANMHYINQNGISIFLDVPLIELVHRILKHADDDRPLYQKNDEQLLEVLQQKYDERISCYRQANLTITPDTPIKEIVQRLTPYLSI